MKSFLTLALIAIAISVNAQNQDRVNPKNLVGTLRNDTLFVHKDIEEFSEFVSATPREIAFNKFRRATYFKEKTIWFFYVVYDYELFYVGKDKGGREIFESQLTGSIKYIPRVF